MSADRETCTRNGCERRAYSDTLCILCRAEWACGEEGVCLGDFRKKPLEAGDTGQPEPPNPRDTEIERLRARLAEAQETNTRLNRRCQEAESIANSKMDEAGAGVRTVGRALANAAASRYLRERDESRAGLDALLADIEEHLPTYAADAETETETASPGETVEHAGAEIRRLTADLAAAQGSASTLQVEVDRLRERLSAALHGRDALQEIVDRACLLLPENERLEAQVAHLRRVIEGAPHPGYCPADPPSVGPCTCWKARALRGSTTPNPVGSGEEGTDHG